MTLRRLNCYILALRAMGADDLYVEGIALAGGFIEHGWVERPDGRIHDPKMEKLGVRVRRYFPLRRFTIHELSAHLKRRGAALPISEDFDPAREEAIAWREAERIREAAR